VKNDNVIQPIKRRTNLTNKLSLLFIGTVILSLSILGFYFNNFLKQTYLDNTQKQMAHAFTRLASDLGKIEKDLKEGTAFLQADESMLASVNLINHYHDVDDYNTLLLDEEKKRVVEQLLYRVKLSLNNDIALYNHDEELIAFVTKENPGYRLNFVSYKNGEHILYSRYEHELFYREVPYEPHPHIEHKHKLYYKLTDMIPGATITYHLDRSTIVVKSHQSIYEGNSDRVGAHVELSYILDNDFFKNFSDELALTIRHSKDERYAATAVALDTAGQAFHITQHEESFESSAYIKTNDGPVYFTVVMETAPLQEVLQENRWQFLILLLAVAIALLLLMRLVFRHALAKPLALLMQQIDKIEHQDYSPSDPLRTGDELEAVSENINRLALAVDERESSLRRTQKDLAHLSHHDPLTDLPNRRFFKERLEHALKLAERNKTRLALMFLDLDHFKLINDTLGHDIGDLLLTKVTKRLKNQLREVDTLARIGGDEFHLLIEDIDGITEIETVVKKLVKSFQKPFVFNDHEVNSTVSIGIAVYPNDGLDSVNLTKHADLAMYRAKDNGRNSFSFYSQELSVQLKDRSDKIAALSSAIANGEEFRLQYQPKISLKTGNIHALEALIRWESPVYGYLGPLEFIPLAEESGQIISIGQWVLDRACNDFMYLINEGYPLDHVSINVSNIQLQSPNFTAALQRTMESTGIAPGQIELELTESYLATDAKKALKTLLGLRNIGIRIAVDDFGTGYSSISYLKQLPITRVKIDKTFVDGLPDDHEDVAIANAIIALAKSFELDITAEGVETQEQLKFLASAKCDEVQGYLYAPPLSIDDLMQYCRELKKEEH
jgi:diguanylate cyclase (GGDEF)-like protein